MCSTKAIYCLRPQTWLYCLIFSTTSGCKEIRVWDMYNVVPVGLRWQLHHWPDLHSDQGLQNSEAGIQPR